MVGPFPRRPRSERRGRGQFSRAGSTPPRTARREGSRTCKSNRCLCLNLSHDKPWSDASAPKNLRDKAAQRRAYQARIAPAMGRQRPLARKSWSGKSEASGSMINGGLLGALCIWCLHPKPDCCRQHDEDR